MSCMGKHSIDSRENMAFTFYKIFDALPLVDHTVITHLMVTECGLTLTYNIKLMEKYGLQIKWDLTRHNVTGNA